MGDNLRFELLNGLQVEKAVQEELEKMIQKLGADFIRLQVSRNLALSRDGTHLKGLVVAVRPETKALEAFLTKGLGAGVSVFRIATIDKDRDEDKPLAKRYKDKEILSKLDKLKEAVPTTSSDPYDYKQRKTGFEPALGKRGTIAIVKRKRENNDDIKDVLMIVNAFPEEAAANLYQKAIKDEWSIADLYASKEYQALLSASETLRRAIAARVAQVLELDADMSLQDDVSDNSGVAKLAEPSIECGYNRIYALAKGQVYAYYNNVFNTQECHDGLVYGISPELGYLLFEGDPYTAEMHGKSITQGGSWANEDTMNAFPIGTGRALDNAQVRELSYSTGIPERSRQRIKRCMTWDGQVPYNTNVFPKLYRAAKTTQMPEFAYNSMGYNRDWAVSKLKPLIVRVPPEDIGSYALPRLCALTSPDDECVLVPLTGSVTQNMVRHYPSLSLEIENSTGQQVTLSELFKGQIGNDYLRLPREYANIMVEMNFEGRPQL